MSLSLTSTSTMRARTYAAQNLKVVHVTVSVGLIYKRYRPLNLNSIQQRCMIKKTAPMATMMISFQYFLIRL